MVPEGSRSILELGCSTGATARLLRDRGAVRLVGVDHDPAFLKEAETVFDQVVTVDLNAGTWAEPLQGPFDCVIAADVLEHLVDPWGTLLQAVELLDPDGCVVLSIPNVRHIQTILGLMRGRWPYRSRGVHDSTHLRFFTLREIEGLCTAAGLRMDAIHRKPRFLDRPSGWDRVAQWAVRTPFRELFTFQYVVRAVRSGDGEEPEPEHVPPWARPGPEDHE